MGEKEKVPFGMKQDRKGGDLGETGACGMPGRGEKSRKEVWGAVDHRPVVEASAVAPRRSERAACALRNV